MSQTLRHKLSTLLLSLLLAALSSALLLFILSFLLYKLRLNNGTLRLFVCLIYVLSCFSGGFLAGKRIKTRRFLWGAVSGLLYVLVLFLLSALSQGGLQAGTSGILTAAGLCIGGGTAGGMLS
ncbi:MAG: TIGR04086 family membrane protein [Lachnospiraceae bacterium]